MDSLKENTVKSSKGTNQIINEKGIRILLPIIYIIIACISFCLDQSIKIEMNSFIELNKLVFEFNAIAFGIIVTCYLLFVELYKDRYPLKLLNERSLKALRFNAILICITMVFGCLVIYENSGAMASITFIAMSFFTIIYSVLLVFNTSKTMMVSNLISDYCKEIDLELSGDSTSIQKSKTEDLNRILDECILRKEYSAAKTISDKSSLIFRDYLSRCVKYINSGETTENVEKSLKRIMGLGCTQIYYCDEIESDILVNDIIDQQRENLKICIDTNQYEWFKVYIDRINSCVYKMIDKDKVQSVDSVFRIYRGILKYLIKKDKPEWVTYFVNSTSKLQGSMWVTNNPTFISMYISYIIYGLKSIDKEDEYNTLFNSLQNSLSITNLLMINPKNCIVDYTLYLNHLLTEQNSEHLTDFVQMMVSYSDNNNIDSTWKDFSFYCISRTTEKVKYYLHNIKILHNRLLVKVIEQKNSYSGAYLIPPYKELLFDNIDNKELTNEIVEDIKYLLSKCIISDNMVVFYDILQCLKECITNATIEQTDIQESLFSVYLHSIEKAGILDKKQYAQIISLSVSEVITALDTKRSISEKFGEVIIKDISGVADYMESADGNYTALFESVKLLNDFMDDSVGYHFSSSLKMRKMIGNDIYKIGISCIENNQEDGLRLASNSLGWAIISCLKNDSKDTAQYYIQLAGKMLTIANNMNVSKKTIIFLLTLFTTVGMFCSNKPEYQECLDYTLNVLHFYEYDSIKTAIDMRTYENDMFDELFENNTEELRKILENKLEKEQSYTHLKG